MLKGFKMKRILGCHNCPFNGKHDNACISCTIIEEEYSHPFGKYVLPTYDAPQPETRQPQKVTNLKEDDEESMLQKLYSILDLDFIELLLLKSIINGKSLTEFAREFNDFIDYNRTKKTGEMTRFCAFQIRKRMVAKLGSLALLTKGQKKALKGEQR